MGLIQKIALSNWGQKLYKHAADPKNRRLYDCNLPTLETIFATCGYCWATHRQKDIDHDRKMLLQTQNILSGVAGAIIGSWANRKVSDYADKVIPHLKTEIIPDAHKVVAGLKIGLPILVTGLLMRCITPSIIAWVSGKTEEVRRSRRDKRLNVKA